MKVKIFHPFRCTAVAPPPADKVQLRHSLKVLGVPVVWYQDLNWGSAGGAD